jgi:hypothetical protein
MNENIDTIPSEEKAWADLSPDQRFKEYCSLFSFYLLAGGSLGPEHDSQSPFDFEEYYSASTTHSDLTSRKNH